MRTLHARLSDGFPFPWRITVVDNASTDGTLDTAHRLAGELPGVGVVHLDRKGRGLALRTVWGASRRTSWRTWTSTCPRAWMVCSP